MKSVDIGTLELIKKCLDKIIVKYDVKDNEINNMVIANEYVTKELKTQITERGY